MCCMVFLPFLCMFVCLCYIYYFTYFNAFCDAVVAVLWEQHPQCAPAPLFRRCRIHLLLASVVVADANVAAVVNELVTVADAEFAVAAAAAYDVAAVAAYDVAAAVDDVPLEAAVAAAIGASVIAASSIVEPGSVESASAQVPAYNNAAWSRALHHYNHKIVAAGPGQDFLVPL